MPRAILHRREGAIHHVLPARHSVLQGHARHGQPGAQHQVGLPGEDGLHHPPDQLRLVLAVGMQHHHHVGVALQGLEVARLLVGAVARVVGVRRRAEAAGGEASSPCRRWRRRRQDHLVHPLHRDLSTVASSVRAAFMAGITTITLPGPVSHGAPPRRRCRRAARPPPRRWPAAAEQRRMPAAPDQRATARRHGAVARLRAAYGVVEVGPPRQAALARGASRTEPGRRASGSRGV